MKFIVTLLLVFVTSCVTSRGIIDKVPLVAGRSITELPQFEDHSKEKPTKQLQHNLVTVFNWLAVITLLGAVIAFALGKAFPIVGDLQMGRTLGLIAVGSMGVVYATSWMWWIIGGTFWIFVIYFLYRLLGILKEKRYAEKVVEELATHFDDPEGREKLSEDAQYSHLMHRSKGHLWKENMRKTKMEK